MTYSLLYKENAIATAGITPKVLAHLSLDRSLAAILHDQRLYDSLIRVLSEFSQDIDTIHYRHDILRDFSANSELLSALSSLNERFEELRISAENTKRDSFRINIEGSDSLQTAENLLRTNALTCKRALLFIKAFYELLAAARLTSEGLRRFASECQSLCKAEKFESLLSLCVKYELPRPGKVYDFRAVLDDRGRIISYRLIDHRHIHITDPEISQKRRLFKIASKEVHPCARLHPTAGDTYDSLAVSAIASLNSVFASIAAQIFERFSLGRELDFYIAAHKYISALEEGGIPVCYPSFSNDGRGELKGLRDLYLCTTSKPPVPNDVSVTRERGLLIFGKNSSGKTTFLRSVGCMQILAQAGLPIPAEAAQLTVYTALATQFSEAEKSETDTGRFEKESCELSSMLDTLREGALVLLNETFQSTAYTEGADALAAILEYLGDMGITWIAVSHLSELTAFLSPDTYTKAVMSDGYKLETLPNNNEVNFK